MGAYKDARKVFELSRDMANDFEDWGQLILAYESIAKTCLEDTEYANSLVAAKKMMQVCWFANSPDFEISAYDQLGRTYFYLQYVSRAEFYNNRVRYGVRENPQSVERKIATELFIRNQKLKTKMNKHEKLGYRLVRRRHTKIVDQTVQDYSDILEAINLINNLRGKKPHIMLIDNDP